MAVDESPYLTFCIRNKILVYPVIHDIKTRTYQIEVNVKGEKKKFDKVITADEIDESMLKTHKYYYDKFKNS